MDLSKVIRVIPNFPKEGIRFQDITTLIKDKTAFKETIDQLYDKFKKNPPDYIAAIESRGYLFGAPLAYKLGCGLVIVRKPGKLPWSVEKVEYELEYGVDALEIHQDAVEKGKKVVVIDDLLATGGTAGAACKLIGKVGGIVSGAAFIVELDGLNGRKKLPRNLEVYSLLKIKE